MAIARHNRRRQHRSHQVVGLRLVEVPLTHLVLVVTSLVHRVGLLVQQLQESEVPLPLDLEVLEVLLHRATTVIVVDDLSRMVLFVLGTSLWQVEYQDLKVWKVLLE